MQWNRVKIGFNSQYQKGLPNVCSVEKVRSLGIGEGIPLKKDRNRREEREEH